VSQRRALICYDGSENAARAIEVAAEVLSPRPWVVLDVTVPLTAEEREAALFSPVIVDNTESRVHDVSEIARRGVHQAERLGIDAVERVDVAYPTWEGVVEVANEIDAAVIVVGSRGLHGARELFEGSLSHDLMRHAGRPLLIVPPAGG
jgi:nucleotide-binding universal stress UspA family protein